MSRIRSLEPAERCPSVMLEHGLLDSFAFIDTGDAMWQTAVPCLIATSYGLCHLLGWFSTFPTVTESVYWRVSGLCVIVCGSVPFTLSLLWAILDRTRFSVVVRSRQFGARLIFYLLMIYVGASCFLVVESVRQLLYLPNDALKQPDFSVYIPHFV